MTSIASTWPKDFINRIESQFKDDASLFINALQQEVKTSVRINPHKFSLTHQQEQIAWSKQAYFLNERPNFALDPLWHAGAYYVQEASSMFLEQAFKTINNDKPQLILDLCAAPGGKSTHLNSLIKPNDLLVSNELIRSRVAVLYENLTKWGYNNHIISNNDPKQFGELGALFDIVLIDAPCSGEGLFRRDAKAADEWSIENTKLCTVRQRRIFADSLDCLKEGGYLIYSTCTFNPSENEENLAWLAEQLEFESIQIPLNSDNWGVDEVIYNGLYGYRFLPHKVNGEGFFISLLRKTAHTPELKLPKKLKSIFQACKNYPTDWLTSYDEKLIFQHKEQIKFIPSLWENEISYLQQQLKLAKIGNLMATEKNKNFAPEAELAFSVDLNANAFKQLELSQLDCLNFLARNNFNWESNSKEWELVRYHNTPLGFIKGIGNRYNNYYPKEWRLRSPIPNENELNTWY